MNIVDTTDHTPNSNRDVSKLTKREHFAGLAPNEIPNWYTQFWLEGLTKAEHEKYHYSYEEYGVDCVSMNQDAKVKMYFAWRTYYADALLKELGHE